MARGLTLALLVLACVTDQAVGQEESEGACSAMEKQVDTLSNQLRLQKHEMAGLNKRFENEQTAHESTVAELRAVEAAAEAAKAEAKAAKAEAKKLMDTLALELAATTHAKAELKRMRESWNSERATLEADLAAQKANAATKSAPLTMQMVLDFAMEGLTSVAETLKPLPAAAYEAAVNLNTTAVVEQATVASSAVAEAVAPAWAKVKEGTAALAKEAAPAWVKVKEATKDLAPHLETALAFAKKHALAGAAAAKVLAGRTLEAMDAALKSKELAEAKAAGQRALDEVVAATVTALATLDATRPFATPAYAEVLVKALFLLPLMLLPLVLCLGRRRKAVAAPGGSLSEKPVFSEPAPAVYIGSKKPAAKAAAKAATPFTSRTSSTPRTAAGPSTVRTNGRVGGGLVKTKGTTVASPNGERLRMP